jgi:archaemetzincin
MDLTSFGLQWVSMLTSRRQFLLAALLPPFATAAAIADPIDDAIARIRRLFTRKKPPSPGDWLAKHEEPGQTYAQFRAATPRPAIEHYSTMRIVPIGPLSKGQSTVLEIVQDFMKPFFGLQLDLDEPVPLASIPASAQRDFDSAGTRQLLTSHLLNDVLMKRRRANDAAVLGITALDLWPGPGWNFVFGQASLSQRVGVWSMARNGNPDERASIRRLCAIRTAMTAAHETGHMFGMRHCIAYECGMNGSNHAEERDRQPFEFCPECQPKLWWTLRLDPLERSRQLENVARKHGFDGLAGALSKQTAALRAP